MLGMQRPALCQKHPSMWGIDHISQTQEASAMGEVARSIPKINATLEDHQSKF